MRKATRVAAAGMTLAMAGLGLVACSSSTPAAGGNGGSSSKIASSEFGPITVVQGKDNNGVLPILASMWNKTHPSQKVTFKQQSDQADQQLQDLLLHFQKKSTDYDVVASDVVWTQELAANGYLQPLSGAYKIDTSAVVPAVLNTAKYRGTLYAAPASTDSQILFYNKKLLGSKPVPTTYAQLLSDCDAVKGKKAADGKAISCYAGQYAKYEGLTVNFSEAVNSAGGTVVNSSGAPTLNTAAAKQGLTTLVNAYKNGDIPKAAITWQEEQVRPEFEAGHLLFMTNWPYAVSLAQTDGTSIYKNDKSNLGLAGFMGKSSLGGHNWAISAYSKHKGTALAFVKWYETSAVQTMLIQKASTSPVLSSSYSDTSITSKYPYLLTLKKSLDNAVPRPATPYYNAVTTAIQDNAYAALKGSKSVDQALTDMTTAIKQAGS